MMKKNLLFMGFIMLFNFSALAEALKPGTWRFEMKADYGVIPFIVDLDQKGDVFTGTLHNGKESIKLTDIEVKKDIIIIPLQTYEMTLEMELPKDGAMNGLLVRHNKNPIVKTPVGAKFNEKERFPGEKAKATIDLNGRWAVTLDDEGTKSQGVLVFEQKGNSLNGSLLTPTGDYRYMEGYVSGNQFEAASFDGVYNYVVKGSVVKGKIDGSILANYKTKFSGAHNNKANLPDAYKQTEVSPEALNFEFPDLSGKKVTLKDEAFKNKPVILQFFGSWCPNCMDEMNFLIPWYKENSKRGIEIVALSFERSLSEADAKKQLMKTQKKKEVPYTLLLAGSTSADKPAEKIPGIKNFISFPTTIFLNRKHEVVKVHAGFTGPSTGEFFTTWKKEFNSTVNELLKK